MGMFVELHNWKMNLDVGFIMEHFHRASEIHYGSIKQMFGTTTKRGFGWNDLFCPYMVMVGNFHLTSRGGTKHPFVEDL